MLRKAYKEILKWNKKANKKPLILMGARQVGKTWLMEEFARNEYPGNTVVVNLMKNESLRARFDTLNLDSDSVIDVIQLAWNLPAIDSDKGRQDIHGFFGKRNAERIVRQVNFALVFQCDVKLTFGR